MPPETRACAELEIDNMRLAYGELTNSRRGSVTEHLEQCPDCSELVTFVQKFTKVARAHAPNTDDPGEPHPDPSLIVDLEAEKLDPKTTKHVSAHLLFCKSCREEYFLVSHLNADQFEEKVIARACGVGMPIPTGVRIDQDQGSLIGAAIYGTGRILKEQSVMSRGAATERAVTVEDSVVDKDSGAQSTIRVYVESDDPEKASVTLSIEASPPRPDWRVKLESAVGTELKSEPIVEKETLLKSGLPPDLYMIQICRDDDEKVLANFRLEIRKKA